MEKTLDPLVWTVRPVFIQNLWTLKDSAAGMLEVGGLVVGVERRGDRSIEWKRK